AFRRRGSIAFARCRTRSGHQRGACQRDRCHVDTGEREPRRDREPDAAHVRHAMRGRAMTTRTIAVLVIALLCAGCGVDRGLRIEPTRVPSRAGKPPRGVRTTGTIKLAGMPSSVVVASRGFGLRGQVLAVAHADVFGPTSALYDPRSLRQVSYNL